jgi:lysozyme
MELIEDWKQVLFGAWSSWGNLMMAFISALYMALPFFDAALQFDPMLFAIVMLMIGLLNSGLRVLRQDDLLRRFMRDTSGAIRRGAVGGAAGLAAAVALATPMISEFEGRELQAYRDIVGVWTICDGETLNVQPGDVATDAECDEKLRVRVNQFASGISTCLPPRLAPETMAAFTSGAYNFGVGGFCGSSMSSRALAGDLHGACDALLKWDKGTVKGVFRAILGLTIRRKAERALCLRGLA